MADHQWLLNHAMQKQESGADPIDVAKYMGYTAWSIALDREKAEQLLIDAKTQEIDFDEETFWKEYE